MVSVVELPDVSVDNVLSVATIDDVALLGAVGETVTLAVPLVNPDALTVIVIELAVLRVTLKSLVPDDKLADAGWVA
jgi:hypothetical protein